MNKYGFTVENIQVLFAKSNLYKLGSGRHGEFDPKLINRISFIRLSIGNFLLMDKSGSIIFIDFVCQPQLYHEIEKTDLFRKQ